MDVSGHDSYSFGVDCAEVGVFEKTNHVSLSGFLESEDGRRLESEVILEVVGDFSDESLERKLSNEELGGFLVLSDHSEGDGSWSESVGLLDSTGGWHGGLGGLGDHLSWGLGAGSSSSGLLGSCHLVEVSFGIVLK